MSPPPADDTPSPAPNTTSELANRLGEETSPYLLQHRDNPVAWQPWGEEALAAARASGRPVLLSVGYAACHWCHVMAHESFENETIAALMNKLFVNIKVDREERPDLDGIYQAALALMGEQGGWPLTMFLTPAGEPFWGGTYFPPEPRYGRPGFPQVLASIAEVYGSDPDRVTKNVETLKEALGQLAQSQAGAGIPLELTTQIAQRLAREFDPVEGGLGAAPKFPQPSILKLLWRAWKRTGDDSFRAPVDLTLTKMCQGGIYDHLGGGFARYSVDAQWLVPHFEKMLYDNAQMIQCLTWAWLDTGNPLYEARVRETIAWTLKEMIADSDGPGENGSEEGTTPCGAFAATLDADSEGEEGRFYVWSQAEVDNILGDDAPFFSEIYDVTPEGNWEGKTILNRSRHAALRNREEEETLAALRDKLLDARALRIRPGWDDKVLADWNGLMITALAEASMAFAEPAWLAAAETAFAFVCDNMTVEEEDGEKRLRHSWRHGILKHPASLDDYATLCDAAVTLFESTGKDAYVTQAEEWLAVLDRHHWDAAAGGYYFAADDTPGLVVRAKNAHDNATPSGNGVLLGVLARLAYLTGKAAHRERAEALLAAFAGEVNRNFFPLATLLCGNELLRNALQVVVVGKRGEPDCEALLRAVTRLCLPDRVLQVVDSQQKLPETHPAAAKIQQNAGAIAYICRGQSCSLPIGDPDALTKELTA